LRATWHQVTDKSREQGASQVIEREDPTPAFDVFVSYARADWDVIAPFVTALKRDGFKVWLDDEQMAGGVPVMDALAEAVSQSAHMIVCLTDTYPNGASPRLNCA
jgi:hypothetical protein